VPEHLDAVSGFILTEAYDAASYVLRIEKFHISCVSRCKNSKFA
jgi:hypothetical protein